MISGELASLEPPLPETAESNFCKLLTLRAQRLKKINLG